MKKNLLILFFLLTSLTVKSQYRVDVEDATKTGYALGAVQLNGRTWELNDAVIGTSTTDRFRGARSIRLRNGLLTMTSDKPNGAGEIVIYHAKFGTDANSAWKLEISNDGGINWTQLGSNVSTTSILLTKSVFSANTSGNIRIRITNLSPSGVRVNFDDIKVNDYPSTPTVSFSPTNVAFTNQSEATVSAPRSYTINYSNLLNTDMTLSTSAPFSIATSETGTYGTSITFNDVDLNATTKTVYVKFSPTATGLQNGTIAHNGAGLASTNNLAISGTGIAATSPTLSFTPNSLNFVSQNWYTTTELSYDMTYSSLDGTDLTLNTTSPFRISKTSGTGFSNAITFTNSELTLGTTRVYVAYSPTNTGNSTATINHFGGGLSATQTINVSGTSVATDILLTDTDIPVNQDFNAIGTVAAANLPAGWKMSTAGITTPSFADAGNFTATNQAASSGSPTTGGRYNWGQSNSERSIGFMTSGSYANPNSIMAAYRVGGNNGNLLKLNVEFAIKRYRINAAPVSVQFYYSTNGTTWTAVNAAEVTAAELVANTNEYTFTNPATVNKTVVVDVNAAVGTLVYLRWNFNTSGTSSQGVGLDDVSVTPIFGNSALPIFSFSTNNIAFGNQSVNTAIPVVNYTLNYNNLDGSEVNLTVPAPFSIAKSASGTYSNNLQFTNTELGGASGSKIIYLKYSPVAVGNYSGLLNHAGGGTLGSQGITISGGAVDPNQTAFDFETCTPAGSTTLAGGFTQFSVSGAETWACTSFGHDITDTYGKASAGNGVQISGFANGANNDNVDWLISPAFDLSAYNYPIISYWSRTRFAGARLQLKVSTNYSGTGDPNASGVVWTNLEGKFPSEDTDTWTKSDHIDLNAYKSNATYVAFVYTSTVAGGAPRWTLDDFVLTNSSTPAPAEISISPSMINFGFQAANTSSAEKSFSFSSSSLTTDVAITAPTGVTISKTAGSGFANTLNYIKTDADNSTQKVYVKFAPNLADENYSNPITVNSSGGLTTKNIVVYGNSLNLNKTLEVVNWNIEWFGSRVSAPATITVQGPNVRTVVDHINADLYAFCEVVDTVQFRARVLPPGYNVIFSEFGSYANDMNDPDYELAQKLAFMYRTDIVHPKSVMGLLRDGYLADTTNKANGTPFKNWSSGRFPYMMKADVTINGTTSENYFILLHAKANTGQVAAQNDSYDRRAAGNAQLKTYIDNNLAGKRIIILGDFNDVLDLNKTIAPKPAGTGSSYSNFVQDNANYVPLTLPLSLAGGKSTIGFNTIIDNVMISKEMDRSHIANSTAILTDVESLVANYGSTTTDHYPVLSRYYFTTATLPIQMGTFTAIPIGSNVSLKWNTVSENNNDYFTVERAVVNNVFVPLQKISGAGNSVQLRSYSFIDSRPELGTNYYRIKQTDLNGDFSYSEVKSVNFVGLNETKLTIYPNPTTDKVTLSIVSNSNANTLQLTALDGKVLLREKGNINFLNQRLNANLERLQSGLYLIKMVVDGQTYNQKLVKQ